MTPPLPPGDQRLVFLGRSVCSLGDKAGGRMDWGIMGDI